MKFPWKIPPLAALLVAAAAAPLPAQEGNAAKVDPAMEELRALQKEYRSKARDASVKQDGEAAQVEAAKAYLPKFRAFADTHPGTDAGLAALGTVLNLCETMKDDAAFESTFDAALKSYGDRDSFAGIVGRLHGPTAEKRLEQVIAASPNREVKAAAQMAIGGLFWKWGEAEGEERAKARAAFETVTKTYPGTKAAKRAAGNLYEIDHLQVGMKAPEIAFPDVAGKPHKLSDFRGKVALLVFWASW
jgi:hypothetical protein